MTEITKEMWDKWIPPACDWLCWQPGGYWCAVTHEPEYLGGDGLGVSGGWGKHFGYRAKWFRIPENCPIPAWRHDPAQSLHKRPKQEAPDG